MIDNVNYFIHQQTSNIDNKKANGFLKTISLLILMFYEYLEILNDILSNYSCFLSKQEKWHFIFYVLNQMILHL